MVEPRKIHQIWPLKRVKGDMVGVEIEMEGYAGLRKNFNNLLWAAKLDGSLRDNGIEFVLNKPVPRKDVRRMLAALRKRMARCHVDTYASERCGVHIHINCQDMTEYEVMKAASLYFILEDLLVRWCGQTREGNPFCLRMSDAEAQLSALQYCCERGSLGSIQRNGYRYSALNFSTLSKYGTLEFRALQSTSLFNPVISTWVEMLSAVFDAAKSFEYIRDMVEGASVKGHKLFIESVMGTLATEIDYPDGEELLMEGLRRVQDLAYTDWSMKGKINDYDLDIQY